MILLLRGALDTTDFFLLALGGLDDRLYFFQDVALGLPGKNDHFNTLPGSPLFGGFNLDVTNPLFLEILYKTFQYGIRFSLILIGKHRHKFMRTDSGGKAPDGTKVLVDKQARTMDQLLCRIVTQAADDGIQRFQSKNHNRVTLPLGAPFQTRMILDLELPFGTKPR